MGSSGQAITRRAALAAGAASTLALLAACAAPETSAQPVATTTPPPGRPRPTAPGAPIPITVEPPPPPAPDLTKVPAPHEVITGLPGDGSLLAWTVDDGASSAVVGAYAAFATETGTRLTLFATGSYSSWEDNGEALLPLVASGQVQLANHTWSHADLTTLDDAGIRDELQRTHDLIGDLYGEHVSQVEQVMRAGDVPPRIAGLLNVRKGSTVIHVERIYRLQSGKLVELSTNIYPASEFRFSLTLHRSRSPELPK